MSEKRGGKRLIYIANQFNIKVHRHGVLHSERDLNDAGAKNVVYVIFRGQMESA